MSIEKSAKENDSFVRCARRQIPRNMSLGGIINFGKRIMHSVQNHYRCSFTCFKNKSS